MKLNAYALILIGIMVMSTFGYAILYATPSPKTGMEIKSSVINYELDENTKLMYMQHSMTFVTLYHNNKDDAFVNFIRSIPENYKTNLGETQVIVIERIKNVAIPYVKIESINGVKEFNTTDIQAIKHALCELLVFKPVSCVEHPQTPENATILNVTA